MTKDEIDAIAEAVHARLVYDSCPECGALAMRCAKFRGEYTECGVTDRPIKQADVTWDDWLQNTRGAPP